MLRHTCNLLNLKSIFAENYYRLNATRYINAAKKRTNEIGDFHFVGNVRANRIRRYTLAKWGGLPGEIADLDSLTRDVRRRVIPKNNSTRMRVECCLSNEQWHGSITRNARVASCTMKLRYRHQNDRDNTCISRPCPPQNTVNGS